MVSTLDFLITRLLGISSVAILMGQASVLALSVSAHSLNSPPMENEQLCRVFFCTDDGSNRSGSGDVLPGTALSRDALSGNDPAIAYSGHSEYFTLIDSEMEPLVSYTPPGCSDTDSDQTNNCGPADSTDAGTRMSG